MSTIERQIQDIIRRLDELKDWISELPRKFVIELNENAIEGFSARYTQLLNVYHAGAYTPAIDHELKEHVLSPLRDSSLRLMVYHDFGLVPFICTACYYESSAMAMANESKYRAHEALKGYLAWLLKVSRGKSETSLEGKIQSLQATQLADAKAAHDAASQPTVTLCYTEQNPGKYALPRNVVAVTGRPNIDATWYRCFHEQTSYASTPIPEISEVAKQMIKKHLLQPDEEPIGVACSSRLMEGKDGAGIGWYANDGTGALGKELCPGTGHTLSCGSNENAERVKTGELSDRLTSNGLQLISLHALKHAADQGIAFIYKLDPSLKKERVS